MCEARPYLASFSFENDAIEGYDRIRQKKSNFYLKIIYSPNIN